MSRASCQLYKELLKLILFPYLQETAMWCKNELAAKETLIKDKVVGAQFETHLQPKQHNLIYLFIPYLLSQNVSLNTNRQHTLIMWVRTPVGAWETAEHSGSFLQYSYVNVHANSRNCGNADIHGNYPVFNVVLLSAVKCPCLILIINAHVVKDLEVSCPDWSSCSSDFIALVSIDTSHQFLHADVVS